MRQCDLLRPTFQPVYTFLMPSTAAQKPRFRASEREKTSHPATKTANSRLSRVFYGVRYLDPRTSRWISADPAMGEYVPQAPINDEAKKRNGNLPGMGGVFNYVNFHVYHYAGNNPIKLIDPDGKIAEINIDEENKTVNITIPVEFKKGTTDEQKQFFKKSAEEHWSGKYGEYTVNLVVEERDSGKRNKIEFKDKEGRAYVFHGSSMKLFKENSKKDLSWTIGHEVGHLMNLDDHYKDKRINGEKVSVPNAGWENNIMSQSQGSVEKKNIDEILKKNKIIKK